jgi:hypothetical protein
MNDSVFYPNVAMRALIFFFISLFIAANVHSQSAKRMEGDSVPRYKEYLLNDLAFGVTLGSPGGINFVAEQYVERWAFRAEAGALPPFIYGYHGALSYVIKRSNKSLMEISVLVNRTYIAVFEHTAGWNTGLGLGIAINAGGFYFEASGGWRLSEDPKGGIGFQFDRTSPATFPMTFQLGYVH